MNGLNNNGDLAGFSSDAATPTLFTNFIRNTDGTFAVPAIGGDPLAMANGINTSRTVIGMESNSTAFILPSGGPPLALPPSTAPSETAFGINDSGKILGQFTDGLTDTTHGFFLNGGVFTILNPIVIATVTHAQGMNNNGLATGFYSVDGVHQHGFL